jgi:DNA-binding GntR family transcriptional regulator
MEKGIYRKSLKDQVREILLNQIISGELQPGERLKIIPIAKSLNISQAPVREAIQCLATSGYLEVVPNAGVKVRRFSEVEIKEMYEVRKLLEFQCFSKPDLKNKEIAYRLNLILRNMVDSINEEDYKAFARYDNKFHRTFVEASGNAKMLEIWDSLLIPINITLLEKEQKTNKNTVLLYHTPIVDSLAKGNIEDAKNNLADHYEHIGQ